MHCITVLKSWEPEGRYNYPMIFRGEPEGRYRRNEWIKEWIYKSEFRVNLEWIWSEIFIFTHFVVTSVIFEWSLRSLQNEWKYKVSLQIHSKFTLL